eukprot:2134760-Amphidinium_carterae.1
MAAGQFTVSLRNFRDICQLENQDAHIRCISPLTVAVMPFSSQLAYESVVAKLAGDEFTMSKASECCIPLLSNFAHVPGVRDGWRSVLGQQLALTESNLAFASSWSVTSTRLVEALQRESKESYGLLQSYIH